MATAATESVFQTARRKARYGHRDWIVYRGPDGVDVAPPFSREVIKAALLAVGCRGRFYLLHASCGVSSIQNWSLGCLLFRNARFLMQRAA